MGLLPREEESTGRIMEFNFKIVTHRRVVCVPDQPPLPSPTHLFLQYLFYPLPFSYPIAWPLFSKIIRYSQRPSFLLQTLPLAPLRRSNFSFSPLSTVMYQLITPSSSYPSRTELTSPWETRTSGVLRRVRRQIRRKRAVSRGDGSGRA